MKNLFSIILSKCSYNGHRWTKLEEGFIKIKTSFLNHKKNNKVYRDKIYYRECKNCGKKQIKGTLFLRKWRDVDKKPKEIKGYLNKLNLNYREKQELEEYLDNIF